jgi:flagellar motor switch protein FliM
MAESLLTPEELEALAESVDSGDLETDTGFNMQARVVKHDLAAEDSTLGVNLSSIDMINERFIRMFRLGLLEVLRTSPRINPARVRIMKFGDYLPDLKPPLSVTTVRTPPLRGSSMVLIEPNIIFSALDNFFGGFGRGIGALPPGRLFTPTETRIIKMMLDQLFLSLQEAWAPLMPIEMETVSYDINPQFAHIVD